MNIVSIATRLFTSAVLRFSLEQLHASCTLASTLPSLYGIRVYIHSLLLSTHQLSPFHLGQPLDETVTIAIENSTTVQVGDVVEIRCRYSGERIAFKLPSFFINHKTIRVESVGAIKSELSDYEHKHSLALEKGKWIADYKLTLKRARVSDNNTVYQCFSELTEGRQVTRVWSEPVMLTVIG